MSTNKVTITKNTETRQIIETNILSLGSKKVSPNM